MNGRQQGGGGGGGGVLSLELQIEGLAGSVE